MKFIFIFGGFCRRTYNNPSISNCKEVKHASPPAHRNQQFFSAFLLFPNLSGVRRLDAQNPMRTRRAWQVLTQTGIGISVWQDNTPAPTLALDDCIPLVLNCDVDWLNERIDHRFDLMIGMGALDECQNILNAGKWMPDHPSCKAIGARELIAHIGGEMALDDAIEAAKTQTRQYAKRQRTWFRSKMKSWMQIDMPQQPDQSELIEYVQSRLR